MKSLLRKLGAFGGTRPPPSIFDLLKGYRATCVLVTATQLGIFEALREGPLRAEELAHTLGAHEPSLTRLLRALEALGLLENRDRSVGLTRRGRGLLAGETSAPEFARLTAEEYLAAWSNLRHSVLTGEPAFDHAFGMTVWQHRREDSELNECFNRYMQHNESRMLSIIPTVYDFARYGEIVDVGGGHGHLLAAILTAHPRAHGILLDQPHVIEGAASVLEAVGVRERCRLVGGSFLTSVPGGGDLYILQKVLHNWDDDSCAKILQSCRAQLRMNSRLLIIEALMPESVGDDVEVVMRDLHMLALHRGRKRTAAELEALLAAAGFELLRCGQIPTGAHLLEAALG